MVDFSDVEAKRQIAESRQEQALGYSAKGQTLADELRKAIGERFAQSDVAKQGAESRTQFLSAAPQARADVSGLIQGGAILSPTQQQSIIASKRGAALAPVMGANVMQEAAFGTLEDLLNAGVNAWNAQSQYQTGMAGLAQQSYTSLLNELIQKSQIEAQQQQTALQQKQFGLTEAAAGREAELFPIQKQTAEAQLYKLLHPSGGGLTFGQQQQLLAQSKAGEIRQWLATQTNSKDEALQDARALIAKGYDPNIVYGTIDQLYPQAKEEKKSYQQIKDPLTGEVVAKFDPSTGAVIPVSGASATLNNNPLGL